MEVGTVSLYDLADSYIKKTEAKVNTDLKPQPLKAISKKIDGLTREWLSENKTIIVYFDENEHNYYCTVY